MAQKRIRMVQHDFVTSQFRILYDDGTQGVLCYREALARSKTALTPRPEHLVGLTLKQAKLLLGIKE